MEIVKPIILSHKRADRVKTKNAIANCIICVAESEREEYEKHNPDIEVVTHPDTIIGLAPKIAWTYNKYRNCFLVDDDQDYMARNFVDSYSLEEREITPTTAYEILQTTAYLALQMGVKYFGFSNSSNPRTFIGRTPFRLTGYIGGGALGFLDGFKMEMPDNLVLGSDYFLSGINAFHHRLSLLDMRYTFVRKEGTMKSTGGLGAFRNLETEKQTYSILKEYFGSAIQKKHDNGNKKIQHNYERILHIPF